MNFLSMYNPLIMVIHVITGQEHIKDKVLVPRLEDDLKIIKITYQMLIQMEIQLYIESLI